MPQTNFLLTLHMVTSLDGYIASKTGNMDWFETTDYYENGLETGAGDAANFLEKIDCYVMGYNTYKLASDLAGEYGWPYGDKPTIVVTNRDIADIRQSIECYSGDLKKLVNDLLKPRYQNVWLVGGAQMASDFLRLNLVNEVRQSILPVILGDGLPLFSTGAREQPLHLKNVSAYKTGIVELHYEIKR